MDDDAFKQRIVAIPFENQIPAEDQDPDLLDKLKKELPTIARIAFNHYYKFKNRGYRFTEIDCNEQALQIRTRKPIPVAVIDHDSAIKDFFEDCCKPTGGSFEFTENLFSEYIKYCNERNLPTTNIKDFSTRFKRETGLDKEKRGSRNGYIGVKLSVSEQD